MSVPALAPLVAARLMEVPGVRGVALGGSHVTGTAVTGSDIDLCLAYDVRHPFDLHALNALCQELDDTGEAQASVPGGWGPWVNGGAWLTVQGQRVDVIYREVGRVARSVQDACAGRVELYTQIGHPHGIHAHHYAAELASCQLLHDPSGELARLQTQVRVYPAALASALEAHYGWQPGFWLDAADKGMRRGDRHYAQGCVYQALMAMVQVVCARHRVWLLNEKGALLRAGSLPAAPDDFTRRALGALTTADTADLRALAAEMAEAR
ncbi:nucleotidyltransferase domain-containing protein [Deinococcus deserti]|uniref:Polymerase nucleotidyl transferase domain-containing protein n=1 Tax=Deinococcus deserti (strain DSM 17065 / CIP 109153 / LMG 22923 / VCD115) TaxID=546414 RepID=C1D0Q5_DEIDV|nr:nucleotidyltransferase domain-containing protein [Deinococcus deserti]ACO45429.1 hypothetical protein Deide_05890 [Deinococcus deserti VCD115]